MSFALCLKLRSGGVFDFVVRSISIVMISSLLIQFKGDYRMTHKMIFIADTSITTPHTNTEISPTVPTTTTLPFHCDFERGMCGMSTRSLTSLKWVPNKGAVLFSGKQYIKGDNTTGNGKITL